MADAYDVIIIGGGPAGLTAGLYAGRSGLRTLLYEEAVPGGLMATTDIVENYPGFPNGIAGAELADAMRRQTEEFGCRIEMKRVEGFDIDGDSFTVRTGGGAVRGRSLIIASGSSPRKLGIPGEDEFRGAGVSYCATCDGAFFRGKRVVVVGGGDSAVGEAIFLTHFADRVTVVHRREELRAVKAVQDRARANDKIDFKLGYVPLRIEGDGFVQSIRLKDVRTGQEEDFPADGVFVFIGSSPNTGFLSKEVEVDGSGYIITGPRLSTSIPGVFAAGDVRVKFLRQVSTAVGDGAAAAMAAEHFLTTQGNP